MIIIYRQRLLRRCPAWDRLYGIWNLWAWWWHIYPSTILLMINLPIYCFLTIDLPTLLIRQLKYSNKYNKLSLNICYIILRMDKRISKTTRFIKHEKELNRICSRSWNFNMDIKHYQLLALIDKLLICIHVRNFSTLVLKMFSVSQVH